MYEWANWRGVKKVRTMRAHRELACRKATALATADHRTGSLEIRAYDQVCFPGLATEWARNCRAGPLSERQLTMDMRRRHATRSRCVALRGNAADFFSFGSTPVKSPPTTLAMIEVGLRRNWVSGHWCAPAQRLQPGRCPDSDRVKVVRTR